ncbi:DUF1707 domain-containing protein [Streptomyces sp. NPDC001851]|uniref:DUF1707 SHOCT-like domain-containing protein n=1 Tax=Streptomyces sp. NPDC001851 TaxID=3154529 RepID=UPI0033288344
MRPGARSGVDEAPRWSAGVDFASTLLAGRPVGLPRGGAAGPACESCPHDRAALSRGTCAVERVRAAVADGRLPLGELDDRLDQVHSARTLGEPALAARSLPEPGPRDSPGVDRAPPASRCALGVFGGFHRDGEWVVPPRFTAWSMWGGGRLTEIRAAALCSASSAGTAPASPVGPVPRASSSRVSPCLGLLSPKCVADNRVGPSGRQRETPMT